MSAENLLVYRLVVTLPVDERSGRTLDPRWDRSGLEGITPGWGPEIADVSWGWPRRRHFFSRSAATRRAEYLRLLGATVEVKVARISDWSSL